LIEETFGETMKKKINESWIELLQGDITELSVDAIVNAANKHLQLGGGVAGAIRKKGGTSIQAECDKIGGTFVGGAVITSGGNLKTRYVIHAVGPMMGEGNEDEKLKNATFNSLKVALENKLKSIAFPAISTGIFGYPIDRCAKIMIDASREFLILNTGVERVIFCLYDSYVYKEFENYLKKFD
jgi:O-acetyl-ADP-ribose deacetylase